MQLVPLLGLDKPLSGQHRDTNECFIGVRTPEVRPYSALNGQQGAKGSAAKVNKGRRLRYPRGLRMGPVETDTRTKRRARLLFADTNVVNDRILI